MKTLLAALHSFAESVKRKPIAYAVLLFTVVLCGAVSFSCYRISKAMTGASPEGYAYSYKGGNIEAEKIYELFDEFSKDERFYDGEASLEVVVSDVGVPEDEIEKIYYNIHFKQKYNGFTNEELENKEQIVIVSEMYAEENNLAAGDEFDFYGNRVRVKAIEKISGFTVPYYIKINGLIANEVNLYFDSKTELSGAYQRKIEKKYLLNNTTHELESNQILTIGICVFALVACALSTLTAFKYVLNCNSKKYSIYKTLGAGNLKISLFMALENLICALAGFIVGIGADRLLIMGMDWLNIRLSALDYFYVFLIDFGAIVLLTGYEIIKRAKKPPVSL